MYCADLRDRCAKFAGQLEGIDFAATLTHQVAHIQKNECRQAQRKHGRCQHQLPGQVQGIEDQQNSVRFRGAGHAAFEHVDRDACVFGVRGKTIDARKVDQGKVVAANTGHESKALFNGDAREVGHLLTQPGEAIEERGLAGVRWADQHDGAEFPRSGRRYGRFEGGRSAAVAHRAALDSCAGSTASSSERTSILAAVSRRSAISMPSMA